MSKVNKIDSNATSLRIAEEASFKVLPTTPIWVPFEPNSYSDFGGQVTTVARNPINKSRQRKKGVVTDLEASGGFNTDLTQTNITDLLQGFFFSTLRKKGEEAVTSVVLDTTFPDEYRVANTTGFAVGDIIKGKNFTNAANNAVNVVVAVTPNVSVEVADGLLVAEPAPPSNAMIVVVGHQASVGDIEVDVTGNFAAYTSTSLDFTTLGLIPGEWIFVGGDMAGVSFTNDANNGPKRVKSVSTNSLVVDKSSLPMVTEANTSTINLYVGSVLKNELGTDIVRRTYQLEREMGAPDDAFPTQLQYEYAEGAVPSEAVINISTADKITVDLSFIAGDNTTIDGPTAAKVGTRPALSEADAFNTSSDFSRLNMSLVSETTEAPEPLFAFLTELTITINNNLSLNKAVKVLGAFDVTAGTFQVDASLTAYLADLTATKAVRDNANVTIDAILVKSNAGIAIDLPLVSLGDGRANVEQDAAITIPLTSAAATAALVDPNMDHTLLMVFFEYLPNIAAV